MNNKGMITVPVVQGFDPQTVVGSLTVDTKALPTSPDFVFSLGYRLQEDGSYSIVTVSIVSDDSYRAYLDSDHGGWR